MFTRLELGTRQNLLKFDSFSNTSFQFHKPKRPSDLMVMEDKEVQHQNDHNV